MGNWTVESETLGLVKTMALFLVVGYAVLHVLALA